ncbi:MAG: glycosyltransferase 87 family protein [Nocardioides sp.]|uniref:glycosyltransferase 87 family protein n=1 Tax=Nocardioides sp. TaxID=35761 RepID=UPI003D6C09C9
MITFSRRYLLVTLAWLVTRGWVVVLYGFPSAAEGWFDWSGAEWGVVGDVNYYRESLDALATEGVAGTLVEYPVPALLLLWIPYAAINLLGLSGDAFVVAVLAMAALTDLLFMALIVRNRRAEHPRLGVSGAEALWLAAIPALGATAYARFDLFPGIMVGLAVLYAVRKPKVAAAFAAFATGAKYWPILVIPALAASRRARKRVILTVAITGTALAGLSLVLGGWDRLMTPLTYQSERGLQIESVFATPAMVAWGHGSAGYVVDYTEWKAYDISGPTVGALLLAATIASVVAAALVIVWWVLAWRRLGMQQSRRNGDATEETIVWLVLATVAAFLVTNKVLSPQYMLWLLPAAAAGMVLLQGRARRRLGVWSLVLVVATLLTHEIFPRMYGYMLTYNDIGSPWITEVLAWRNGLLVLLFLYAAWRTTRLLTISASAHPEPGAEAEITSGRPGRRRPEPSRS